MPVAGSYSSAEASGVSVKVISFLVLAKTCDPPTTKISEVEEPGIATAHGAIRSVVREPVLVNFLVVGLDCKTVL